MIYTVQGNYQVTLEGNWIGASPLSFLYPGNGILPIKNLDATQKNEEQKS